MIIRSFSRVVGASVGRWAGRALIFALSCLPWALPPPISGVGTPQDPAPRKIVGIALLAQQ